MKHTPAVVAALTLTGSLVIAACAPADDETAGKETAEVGSPNPIAQPATTGVTTACAEPAADLPSWPTGDDPEAEVIPVIMSSLVSVGPSRFLFGLTNDAYRVISSPDVEVSIDFYALGRDPDTPAHTTDAAYLDTQLGRGLYRAGVDFDCAGEWGADVSATLEDGREERSRMRFTVHPQGTTPAIGDAAPRSDSLTATTVAELRQVSTDPNPFPGSFERTVAEVVTAGQPSLVFFATPAFCQTGYCGPTVNLVKSVAIDYEDDIGFVNVEPYELQVTENGLQPKLDADGRLVPVPAVIDYGIPVEPYLFLVDAEGDVITRTACKFSCIFLGTSIEDALCP